MAFYQQISWALRLPKGNSTAVSQAEDVLLDRTLRCFDERYDEVFLHSEKLQLQREAAQHADSP